MNYVFLTTLTVNIVSFSMGTAMSWSSPVTVHLRDVDAYSSFNYVITETEASWITSLLSLGAAVGPLIFGNLSDRWGRKYTILGTGIPLVVGYFIMAFETSLYSLYIGRFLCGLSAGGVLNVLPLYICELAEVHNRGQLSSFLNIFTNVGSLFSFCLGPYVSVKLFNSILTFFPCIFLVLFFFIGTESPYYYVSKAKYDCARQSLQKIRGNSTKIEEELNIIKENITEAEKGTISDIFSSKINKKAFFIILGIMSYQALSGVAAIFCYSQSIFVQSGVLLSPAVCSILIGLIQSITSFIIPLSIDRFGRKKLLLLSSIGMFLSEGPLAIYLYFKDYNYDVSSLSLLPLFCLLVFIVAFNIGFGPLPWIIMGEILPTNVKSTASSCATFYCCIFSFLIAKYFHAFNALLGIGLVLTFFTVNCGISIVFIAIVFFETRGKTLQEIQFYLGR